MPIVPTGYYYTPALRSRGAEGFFEGALGGLDRVQAQDFARERLRNMREERQFLTAGRVGGLQESLMGDPLGELMAGDGAPRRAGGGGRYSTARERAGGQAGPISQVDAEEAARFQHALAVPDRALREYQSAQSDYLGAGGPPPLADVGTGRPDFEVEPGPTPADMARPLQRDAFLEDEGTRRLRAALFEDQGGDVDVLLSPLVNEYRERLAEMSDEAFEAEDLRGQTEGAYRDAMSLDPGGFDEWISERRSPEGEGWSWKGDPITKFASSLGDESVDPRDAPPAFQAIEDAIRTTESPRDRKVLERAYDQLQRGVASEARARMSGDYEGQRAADAQIEEATNLLDPALLSAMDLARPEFGMDERYENLPEAEKEYKRRMSMYSLPISLEMTPGYEGIWNPAVDIGLAATTILNPSTLSAIGSLADDGNPMAARMLGRLGAEPISAQEAIKKGLVGDVVEYRSKLAAHLNEEQQLLKDAGVDEDEMAKAFLLGLIKIHGPDSFSVDNPDDMAVARGALNLHPSGMKAFMEQLFHATAQGGKEELERLKAKTAATMRKSTYFTAGGGRNEDVKLLGIEVDSLEKLRSLRSKKKFQRSDVEYTPEKYPHLDDEIATLKGEIDATEVRIRDIRSRIYPEEEAPTRKLTVLELQQMWLETTDVAKRVSIEDKLSALGVESPGSPKVLARAKAPAKAQDTTKVDAVVRRRLKGLKGPDLIDGMDEMLLTLRNDGGFSKGYIQAVEGVFEKIIEENEAAEESKIRWSIGGKVLNPKK
jgi:hypothetical protein